MTIQHHPSDELLLAYASGASDEAVSLVVATHLALCPVCRRAVQAFEQAGGEMLAAVAPESISDGLLERAMLRLDEAAPVQKSEALQSSDIRVPEPLRSYMKGDIDKGWTPIGNGISFRSLRTRGRAKARLLRGGPGSVVPTHTHRGNELTLVLTGTLIDEDMHFSRGDVQSATPSVRHRPVVGEGEMCINLAVTDAPLVFARTIPKIVGKLFGI
jgi:putative transcriptional regulator